MKKKLGLSRKYTYLPRACSQRCYIGFMFISFTFSSKFDYNNYKLKGPALPEEKKNEKNLKKKIK